jgi:hypothetical protein
MKRGFTCRDTKVHKIITGIHRIHKVLLHPVKVGVWCAVSARRIVGPVFFHETINCERYVQIILRQFFPNLTEEERLCKTRQLPTPHVCLCKALSEVFRDRIIGSDIWPARSPDLNPCNFSYGVVCRIKFTAITLERKNWKKTFVGKFQIFLQSIIRK